MSFRNVSAAALLAALALGGFLSPARAGEGDESKKTEPLRAGIIGLDTSHVVAFTKALNNPEAPPELSGVRVVAAYPGGSADIPSSHDRVEGYTATLRDTYNVEIVDSIEALLEKVDVVLLESVDGRPHLEQVIPVFKAGKPVFIDKPVAGTLADAVRIYELAEQYKVPCFSSSSLRYSAAITGLKDSEEVGEVVGCNAYSPCSLEEHHPDLFWYGVHGVEILFTIMGTGCTTVTRVHTEGTDYVTGLWEDGRVGTFRGIREGRSGYGALVFGSKGIAYGNQYGGYEPLLAEICKFFRTGVAPVSPEETLEIFAFMEAADESKRQGGAPVSIKSVLEKARAQARAVAAP